MLKIKDLNVSYGEIPALWGIDLEVEQGEGVAVIGSNGAGKTTLLNSIAGFLKPRKGQILYNGQSLNELSPDKIARLGLSYVPAERELFPQLSVMENLELGAYFTPKGKDALLELVFGLFPIMKERKRQHAGTLSGGEQQMLATARGLMSNPKILLLDEPSTGLAPALITKMYQSLNRLKEEGLTILLAEQQVPMALAFSNRAYVLENGQVTLSGDSKDLEENPLVKSAYLGVV